MPLAILHHEARLVGWSVGWECPTFRAEHLESTFAASLHLFVRTWPPARSPAISGPPSNALFPRYCCSRGWLSLSLSLSLLSGFSGHFRRDKTVSDTRKLCRKCGPNGKYTTQIGSRRYRNPTSDNFINTNICSRYNNNTSKVESLNWICHKQEHGYNRYIISHNAITRKSWHRAFLPLDRSQRPVTRQSHTPIVRRESRRGQRWLKQTCSLPEYGLRTCLSAQDASGHRVGWK